jgi:hypothetical protein
MNSASRCSLAGRYDNPIPTRFLARKDCLKIPALVGRYDNPIPPRFLVPLDCLKTPALYFMVDEDGKKTVGVLGWAAIFHLPAPGLDG